MTIAVRVVGNRACRGNVENMDLCLDTALVFFDQLRARIVSFQRNENPVTHRRPQHFASASQTKQTTSLMQKLSKLSLVRIAERRYETLTMQENTEPLSDLLQPERNRCVEKLRLRSVRKTHDDHQHRVAKPVGFMKRLAKFPDFPLRCLGFGDTDYMRGVLRQPGLDAQAKLKGCVENLNRILNATELFCPVQEVNRTARECHG